MGSKAAVDCDPGYKVVGDKYISCGLDGTWSKFTKCAAIGEKTLNPNKSSVLYVGRRQTAQTQFRRHRMRRLIRVSAVCLQNALLKFEIKRKVPPTTLKTEMNWSNR